MLLSMLVSLYTSRVVINTLGVEDYGIYGVVGGVVLIFSFLNSSMSGSTSRFLSYAIGRNEIKQLNQIFSAALTIQIALAFLVFILAETIGLWLLEYKLIVPENRMFAARWVYQLSILSMMIGITQVPYNASIIAHENMDVYAYVELGNVFLKLIIVYLLQIGNFDKLIFYAILVFVVSLLIAIIYRIYCVKNFSECQYYFHRQWSVYKPLLSFSGWELFGHLGFTFRIQGTSILLNLFFGPVVNAANALATTIQGVLITFSSNIVMAVRPAVIKKYAVSDINSFNSLLRVSARLSYFLMFAISIPVIIHLSLILQLWIGNLPEHSLNFITLCILFNCISSFSSVIYIGIQATNKVKESGILRSIIFFSYTFILYIVFVYHLEAEYSYILLIVAQLLISFFDLFFLKDCFNNSKCIIGYLFDIVIGILFGLFLYILFCDLFDSISLFTFIFAILLSLVLFVIISFFTLNTNQRSIVLCYLSQKVLRK